MTTPTRLRYLLLQVRNADDPMKQQEVRCFAETLQSHVDQIVVLDLLTAAIAPRTLDRVDIVLIGGAGRYSVAAGGSWLERALDVMRLLHARSKPTFASCWGFQAMARAFGGLVVTDLTRAEVGSHQLHLTPAGREDPVLGPLGDGFWAQMGHQDIVDRLPAGATLLASTTRVANQAFRLDGKPIYGTQFHPELSREALLERVRAYPEYVERIAGIPADAFAQTVRATPESTELLRRFVSTVMRQVV